MERLYVQRENIFQYIRKFFLRLRYFFKKRRKDSFYEDIFYFRSKNDTRTQRSVNVFISWIYEFCMEKVR